MCGLVGFFGDYIRKHSEAFEDLLIMDTIRGPHSTGVAIVPLAKNKTPTWVKGPCLPTELLNGENYKKHTTGAQRALLGHNRYATLGAVNVENSHPFDFDHIMGMHNGTVRNKHALPSGNKFDTDSEAIMHSIYKDGIEKTYHTIRGAAALVWHNSEEESVNIITNGERPLWFAYTEGTKALFYASEKWMLRGADERRDLKLGKLQSPKPDYLFTFTFEKGVVQTKFKKLEPAPKQVWQSAAATGRQQYGAGDWSYSSLTGMWSNKKTGVSQNWSPYGSKPPATQQKVITPKKETKAEKKARKRREKQQEKMQEQRGVVVDAGPILSLPKGHSTMCKCARCTAYWESFNQRYTGQATLALPPPEDKDKKEEKAPPGGDFRKLSNGAVVSREDFESSYDECTFCGDDLLFEDDDIELFDHNTAACGTCMGLSKLYGIKPHSVH